MRRSLPLIFSVLVTICAVGMTIDQGQAFPRPLIRCGRTGCSESPAPPKPADPPPTQSINIAPLPLPIPDLGGCDPRAHSEATRKFQAKIAKGRESILQGIIAGTSNVLNVCNIITSIAEQYSCITQLCNAFENRVENEAAKKCKEDVERKALEDTECNPRSVICSRPIPRPIQCVVAKKTEKIRVQCCSSLAPQGKADLLAYCDYAAKQVRDKLCPVTPAVDTPVPFQTPDAPLE